MLPTGFDKAQAETIVSALSTLSNVSLDTIYKEMVTQAQQVTSSFLSLLTVSLDSVFYNCLPAHWPPKHTCIFLIVLFKGIKTKKPFSKVSTYRDYRVRIVVTELWLTKKIKFCQIFHCEIIIYGSWDGGRLLMKQLFPCWKPTTEELTLLYNKNTLLQSCVYSA